MIEQHPTGAGRRRLGRIAAPVLVVVVLATAGVALAVPAAALSGRSSTRVAAAAPCARAQRLWARLLTANTKAKAAFTKAQALQNRLIRSDRARLAQRLDVRLAYLRSLHTRYVNLVATIEARIQGRCSASPPQLVSY